MAQARWPKVRPELTEKQLAVMDDWYLHWLGEGLPGSHGLTDRFNHTYPLRSASVGARTLEIGPGNGSHLRFENLPEQEEYVALELRQSLSDQIGLDHPNVRVVVGDCQRTLDFPDDYFDRVLAIHVLEHLDNLPAALKEINRVLKPSGHFSVVIPCEGGLGYSLGRRFTSQRMFEKRYSMPYDWIIHYEHINRAREVLHELRSGFRVVHRTFFPLRIPSVDANLIIGLTLKPTSSAEPHSQHLTG
jgi:SAM-dependent methyltransferase